MPCHERFFQAMIYGNVVNSTQVPNVKQNSGNWMGVGIFELENRVKKSWWRHFSS